MEYGDLVFCAVDFSKLINEFDDDINYPKAGKYYLVRDSQRLPNGAKVITLEDIYNDRYFDEHGEFMEIAFDSGYFIPMGAPDISELTNLLK